MSAARGAGGARVRPSLGAAAGLALLAGFVAACTDVLGVPGSTESLREVCFTCQCPVLKQQGSEFVAACERGVDTQLAAAYGEETVTGACADGFDESAYAEVEGNISGALADAVAAGCASSCKDVGGCYGILTGAVADGAVCDASSDCQSFACCTSELTIESTGGANRAPTNALVKGQLGCCEGCTPCGQLLVDLASGEDSARAALARGVCAEGRDQLQAVFDVTLQALATETCAAPLTCLSQCTSVTKKVWTAEEVTACVICAAPSISDCAATPGAEAVKAAVDACTADLARPNVAGP